MINEMFGFGSYCAAYKVKCRFDLADRSPMWRLQWIIKYIHEGVAKRDVK
jgi:hypothetical protein